jgi:glyoxylase-like metal-dependent hydrolase (beta-lactamase superfamily II)
VLDSAEIDYRGAAAVEIRFNANATQPLATRVFFSDEEAFEVASVIVTGKTDAVLIDAQWTLSSAHRVITEILATGKKLKTIYLTHAHPDHYFGAGVIAQAFPGARVVAISSEADMMNSQFFGKLEIWEATIGAHNVCRQSVHVESLTEDYVELEGQRLEIIQKVIGDMRYNTMVWIPSIKTLYASDVLFNQAHPFTCEVTPDERQQWIREIDRIKAMGAEVIIPGHQRPGMPFDLTSCDFTREYLVATEEELLRTESVGDFYYAMAERFPYAHLVHLSNEMNANVFKGDRDWHWREEE